MKYECSYCWKLFTNHNDIIIQGNGELSCNKCFVLEDEALEQIELKRKINIEAIELLKKRFVNGEITKEEYTEKMARL